MDPPVHDHAVRGRRDDRRRVNLSLVRPAFLLPETAVFAFYGLDPGEPFGVEHPVQSGDDDAGGKPVGGREGRVVHQDRDDRVRVQGAVPRNRGGVSVGAFEDDPYIGGRIEARGLEESGEAHPLPACVADQVAADFVAHAFERDDFVGVVGI